MTRSTLLAGVALLCLSSAALAAEGDGDIVVSGQRAQQERAIEAKRFTIGIADIAASDEIGRLPDRNVAEVVERLPGVGVTYDQGEGRYVAVRGVPSDLNGYTVNGIEIGNPDGQTRALPLDIISGQLLNRVEVNKARTPDMDGQGIGGTINLVTQTAFDFRDRFTVVANGQVGYQELNDKRPIRGDAAVAGRFGSDEQFGITLGGSYSDRTYTSYGIYPDDWRPVAGAARGGLPTNIKYTDYSLKRERIGATGSLDWRPGDDHQVYVRGIYSKFTEDEYRQRYRLDFATDALINSPAFAFHPGGVSGTVSGTPNAGVGSGTGPERRQDLRQEHKAKSVLAGMIGGSSRFDALKLDYVLARVHNEVREPNQLWQFRCNPGTVDFDFSDTVFSAAPRNECSPSQMNFRQYTEQNERGDEDIWQGKVDLTYDLSSLGQGSFLKVGGKYRATDKDFDSRNDTWTRGGNAASRFTLAQFGLAGDPVLSYPKAGKPYGVAPVIDLDAIRAFTAANLPGPYFVLDSATSLNNATLNDFVVDEDVTAGYVMANLVLGKVTVTPGLRYERTKLRITGFRLDTPAGGATVVAPSNSRNSYDDWLPSLLVRVTPSDDTVFRFAYTRSIGRPNYSQLSPSGALNYEAGAAPGTFEGSISFGNPDLKPYRSDNLDATAEWYFAKGGLLSVGVFAKFIKNPIFTQTFTQTDVTVDGRTYAILDTSQPLNADRGDIIGIEGQFQQQFTFLPGLLSGLGVSLTGTYTSSTLKLPDGRSSTFPQQSRYLYGAELFYQKGPLEGSIAYHNTGKSLLAPGGVAYQDQYNNDLRRLDAKISVTITDNIRVYAEAQNLTDEPTRQYQDKRTDWIIQNERYGRTFYGGVSVKF
ncbi:TonB-dependent receptor [Sphingomonas histidinilytica]|uniref:TonB-dependent receptor n=1 Tax=Rhizorhabdus histidinilytica TaxID=439228 RepID=A0A1T5GEV0_9SPHN|nr:TonB-dependent receptor [Rhizorhabdus histidinilytica]MBO9378592.1 TonB-dependent receptor [Rhizorhabdus histidinilytica]SKC06954.1 TonB-dependent receptor [Rhizorhabdus histidinilytica]